MTFSLVLFLSQRGATGGPLFSCFLVWSVAVLYGDITEPRPVSSLVQCGWSVTVGLTLGGTLGLYYHDKTSESALV